LDLVLHLRHAIGTARNGWLTDAPLSAACKVWRSAVEEARRRGLGQPRPCDLPSELYVDAIKAATADAPPCKKKKTRADAPPPSVRLSQQEWAHLRQQYELLGELFQRAG
jgi:hypothetical protein